MSIFEYGRAKRFPLAPPVSRTDAALAASPAQNVATSGFTSCMVSYMASPAVTLPPGLLMYISMSLSASSFSRNSNCAMTRFARLSSMPPPTNTIRSFNRREKISYARSPRAVCSTTIGTKCPIKFPYVSSDFSAGFFIADRRLLEQKIQRLAFTHRVDDRPEPGALAQQFDHRFAALTVGCRERIQLALEFGGRHFDGLALGYLLQQQGGLHAAFCLFFIFGL